MNDGLLRSDIIWIAATQMLSFFGGSTCGETCRSMRRNDRVKNSCLVLTLRLPIIFPGFYRRRSKYDPLPFVCNICVRYSTLSMVYKRCLIRDD